MPKTDEPVYDDPLARALGDRIRQEREASDLTKEQLAERTGFAPPYVWRVEAGRQNLQPRSLLRFARGLDMTISELTAGIEAMIAEART